MKRVCVLDLKPVCASKGDGLAPVVRGDGDLAGQQVAQFRRIVRPGERGHSAPHVPQSNTPFFSKKSSSGCFTTTISSLAVVAADDDAASSMLRTSRFGTMTTTTSCNGYLTLAVAPHPNNPGFLKLTWLVTKAARAEQRAVDRTATWRAATVVTKDRGVNMNHEVGNADRFMKTRLPAWARPWWTRSKDPNQENPISVSLHPWHADEDDRTMLHI
jgi:hypothetical protein